MRNLLEQCFVVVAMAFLTQPFARVFNPGGAYFSDPSQNSGVLFGVNSAVYVVAGFFMLLRWRTLLHCLIRLKWVAALVLLSGVSALWSQAPGLTIRRALALAATSALGLYIGSRYDRSQQMKLLASALTLVLGLTVLFVAFLPDYGIANQLPHFGNWKGIYHQKNMLGRIMVLATIAFAVIPPTGVWKVLKSPMVVASAVVLFFSGSATGFVVLAALVLFAPAIQLLRLRGLNAVPLWIAAALLAAGCAAVTFAQVTFAHLSALASLLDRDSTLTGRTALWTVLMAAISQCRWLGYGFGGFWLGMQGESASVLLAVRWDVLFAHNGFLDLILQLGFVGMAVFGIGYLINFRRAVFCLREDPHRGSTWPMLYLLFVILFNFTESTILATNNLFWVLYVSTSASLVPYATADLRPAIRFKDQIAYELETSFTHIS